MKSLQILITNKIIVIINEILYIRYILYKYIYIYIYIYIILFRLFFFENENESQRVAPARS